MAKTVLGIYIEDDFIRAVVARANRKSVQWLNFFDFGSANGSSELKLSEFIARFKDGLDSSNVSFDEIAVVFDPSKVALKTIDFPFANLKKIEQALPLQLEDSLPFALEGFVYDIELLFKTSNQNRALVALVEKAKLKELIESFAASNFEPSIVTPVASTLTSFVPNAKIAGYWILFYIGKAWATAVLALDNEPLAVSSFEVSKSDPKSAASKLLSLVRSQVQSEELGGGLQIAIAADELWQPFISEVVELLGARHVYAGDALAIAIPAQHLPAAGAVMNAAGLGKKKSINFRKGEFIYHRAKTQQRKVRFRLEIMGAIILVLAFSQGIYKYVSLKKELGLLEKREEHIFTQALPNTPLLKPLEQLRGKVEIDKKKLAILGGIAGGRLTTLEALKKISEAIPDTIKVDVTKLEITSDAIRLSGSTTDYESVDRVVSELGKVKEFISIHKDEARKAGDADIRFKLTVTLIEKGATKP